ncbi:hypothetical protein BHE74_00002885 [Ensete ventricosum]|nr:hypothetical protein GW17_00017166 [Ensete ventricosum]RWW88242.1 hypothetical protein BHE74_00002885 [Ensete ventricosum]
MTGNSRSPQDAVLFTATSPLLTLFVQASRRPFPNVPGSLTAACQWAEMSRAVQAGEERDKAKGFSDIFSISNTE